MRNRVSRVKGSVVSRNCKTPAPCTLSRTGASALVAGGVTPLLALFVPGGVAVLGAGVLGSAVGAWWLRYANQKATQ
ncbi:hypothetical protein BH24CHL1_BH24CHL1_00730 [soil metagenome]|jgi:hypothetical protein